MADDDFVPIKQAGVRLYFSKMSKVFTWLWAKIKSNTKSELDSTDATAPVNTTAVNTALAGYQVATWTEKTDGNDCYVDITSVNVKRTFHVASSTSDNNTPDKSKTWIIECYQSKKQDNTFILNQLAYDENNDIFVRVATHGEYETVWTFGDWQNSGHGSVVANPTLSGTEDYIKSIGIDAVNYKLGGGSEEISASDYEDLPDTQKQSDTMWCIPDSSYPDVKVIDDSVKTDGTTWSSEKIDSSINGALTDLNTYSTTEKVVGTWIDGKPVYELTFEKKQSMSSGFEIMDITNKEIISVIGTVINSNSTILPIPYSNNTYCIYYECSNNKLKLGGNGYPITYIRCIIRYKKTTD